MLVVNVPDKTRLIINSLNEQFRSFEPPIFKCFNGRKKVERTLRDLAVAGLGVVHQGGLEFGR